MYNKNIGDKNMARKEHHVVPNKKGGWDVKINDAGHRTYHTRKKSTAVKKARAISRRHGSELVIHNSKGRIEVKNSHPVPTKRRKKAKRHVRRKVRKAKRQVRRTKRRAKKVTRRNTRKVKRTVRRNKRKAKRTVRRVKRKARRSRRRR